MRPLNFETDEPVGIEEHPHWAEMREDGIREREEFERIKQQAELEELRHNGYWD